LTIDKFIATIKEGTFLVYRVDYTGHHCITLTSRRQVATFSENAFLILFFGSYYLIQ